MSFTLTKEHLDSFLGPAAKGDWNPFVDAIDPNVHWVVNDPVNDSTSLTGTYNLKEWLETIAGPLFAKLIGGKQSMQVDELDIVGNKAIIESHGLATQKNGKPYNNRFCWIMIFSEETGKVVQVREYMNTALVREVMTTN